MQDISDAGRETLSAVQIPEEDLQPEVRRELRFPGRHPYTGVACQGGSSDNGPLNAQFVGSGNPGWRRGSACQLGLSDTEPMNVQFACTENPECKKNMPVALVLPSDNGLVNALFVCIGNRK